MARNDSPSPRPRPSTGEGGRARSDLLRENARLRRRIRELELAASSAEPVPMPRLAGYDELINTVDGIVWQADARNFQFTFVSDQAERLLGYPAESWLSDPAFWLDHLHPEDREWAPGYCYNATRELRNHEFEYRMIAADGRIVWLHDIVTVVADKGEPVSIRGLMVDITAAKQLEARQRREEERIERQRSMLVELATSEELNSGDFAAFGRRVTESVARTMQVERVGIWFFDPSRTRLRCWDLYELGHDRHYGGTELCSADYPAYFAALERGRAVAADDAHNDSSTSEFSELYLSPLGISSMLDAPLRRDGKLAGVVCHEHVGPARHWAKDEQDFAASIADLVSLALETNVRRKAERAAHRAERKLFEQHRGEKERIQKELERLRAELVRKTRLATIGQVAASIAHELRNPLGSIRNAVYYLDRRVPEDQPKWTEYLEIMNQEIHAADRIIRNLLEMSRAKQPLKSEVDLEQAVREVFGRVRGANTLRLVLDLEPLRFHVLADPEQLRQVLANLVLNALQVDPRPRQVTVSARRESDLDRIVVANDGERVGPELRGRVFDPLFTTKAKGTGLGLAICRQIIERHGGDIDLLPDEEAEPGAAFCIRLPHRDPDG